ncbi:amidohydrolase [Nakamurella lactea]|uniref:amidohydrolase n=1 Tax=Nakamurella lactea TaxID=459515 RepID=UPI00041C2AD0|nr:amidohydrolase [Nakamurella lactea]
MTIAAAAPTAPDLVQIYQDLHAHPELSFQETRTASVAAQWLRANGFETTEGVGRTGVVGILRNGDGPTALLRADMDALPVLEDTGLAYASVVRGTDLDGNDVPLMHACGHDVHVTCLLGACRELAADRGSWAGTLMVVFQPAEEVGAGAQAMIDDGLFDRFGRPDVVLGQHVAPLPAGFIGIRPGPSFAAADGIRITLFGRGGHGSRPEATVDPVVMAAATVLRLQTVVSRELAGTDVAVVTVGALRAGTKENIIPDSAELLVSTRSYDEKVRSRMVAAIERIVRAEAAAAGATREPTVELMYGFPAVVNDIAGSAKATELFTGLLGPGRVVDPGLITGSEDVGVLAAASGAPCVFWLLGGGDPAPFAGAGTVEQMAAILNDVPSNHSPHFAPVIEPTLTIGIGALAAAARAWLPAPA